MRIKHSGDCRKCCSLRWMTRNLNTQSGERQIKRSNALWSWAESWTRPDPLPSLHHATPQPLGSCISSVRLSSLLGTFPKTSHAAEQSARPLISRHQTTDSRGAGSPSSLNPSGNTVNVRQTDRRTRISHFFWARGETCYCCPPGQSPTPRRRCRRRHHQRRASAAALCTSAPPPGSRWSQGIWLRSKVRQIC